MRLPLITLLLLTGLAMAQATPSPSAQIPCPTVIPSAKALSQIKRIYVESFGDDPISKEMQSMVIDSLTSSKVLAVTENRDKADAILKGSTPAFDNLIWPHLDTYNWPHLINKDAGPVLQSLTVPAGMECRGRGGV